VLSRPELLSFWQDKSKGPNTGDGGLTERLTVSDLLASLARYWPQAAGRVQAAVLLLYRARDLLYDDLAKVIGPFGLLPADLDLLVALRTQPPPRALTPTVLYRSLFLSSGGLTKVLHRVEAAGLIDRPSNPADRRSRLVRLTGAGEQLLDRVMEQVLEHQQAFLGPLDPNERLELTRLLTKLVEAEPLRTERRLRQTG
jgi:DNA-binding MarR family transcriptional regulator